MGLVRGFEERLITVDRRRGPVGNIVDRAHRVGCGFADTLNVFSCEQQTLRVDVTPGLGALDTSGLRQQDGAWVNDAYATSDVTLNLRIRIGVGAVTLEVED